MVSERWTLYWVTTGQPQGTFDYEILPGHAGRWSFLVLKGRLDVRPASQIVSQTTTETPVRRVGRFVLAALDDATYATATH